MDILAQCAQVGEHALSHGISTIDVHAELGEIIVKAKPGRRSADEIFIFDSTGTALQDVAAAAVYGKALKTGRGTSFDFFN